MDGKATSPPEIPRGESTVAVRITYVGYYSVHDTLRAGSVKSYRLRPKEFGLDQFVVTAQYGPNNPEKSVHKVRIIDRDRIEAQGAVNLKDVLQNEMQMRVSQDPILGSGLSMQGVSGQNVKILVDGVPVIGRLNGNIDLAQLNLNNVERIEIVEGPLSVNYGTDALAGTINLITRKEEQGQGSVMLDSYYESAGQYNVSGNVGLKAGPGNLSISGGRNYFDGWSPEDPFFQFPESKLADSSRSVPWNPKEQYFGKVQYSVDWNSLTYRAYGEYFDESVLNRGLPRPPHQEVAFDDHYNTQRINGGLDVSGKVADESRIRILAAYNGYERVRNTYRKDLTTLQQDLTADPADQDTALFDLFMSRGSFSTTDDSAAVNFELGYDANYETANDKRIDGDERALGDYALFGSAEWKPVDPLTIKPGIRLAYNTAYDAPIIPSINLLYRFENLNLRASYARGFRAPTLKELYFEFVDANHNIFGNNDLLAEQSHNFQLNASWRKTEEQITLSLDGGVFYNNIENLITLAQLPEQGIYSYVNVGRQKTMGGQLSANLGWQHVKLTVGGSYIGRSNYLSTEQDPSYTYTPELRSNIQYDLHEINAQIAMFYKYTGAMAQIASSGEDDISETRMNEYHTLDITLTKRFWNDRIHWSIGAKNLMDVQFVNASNSQGGAHSSGGASVPVNWGRTVFTSLKLDLEW